MENSTQQKIGVFTVHKAASMLLHKLALQIVEIKKASGSTLTYYSPNNKAEDCAGNACLEPFVGSSKNSSEEAKTAYTAIDTGIIGPIRRPINIDPDHPILVCLRDPRDGLVSMYHSFTKIHGGIPKAVRKERVKQGMPAFVMEKSEDYCESFNTYIDRFFSRDNCAFLKYEDMFSNPKQWLKTFATPFALSEAEYSQLEAFFLKEVDPSSAKAGTHKRKMLPGEYLSELPEEIIVALNEKFSRCLKTLEYPLH